MPRLVWSRPLLVLALLLTLIALSLRTGSFEVCDNGCTLLALGSHRFLIAGYKSFTLYRRSREHISINTSWLGPLSLRFIVRNGLLIVYPGLPLSLILLAVILWYNSLRASPKPYLLPTLVKATAALLLITAAHSDFHAFILGSEYQGYNSHRHSRSPELPSTWFTSTLNCPADSFPSFGAFTLVSSGTAPCLLYKFSGTIGLDVTDCDVIQVHDGPDPKYHPYGPFWKRAIFLQQGAKGSCFESGKYSQMFYADNDNIIEYDYQPKLTAPYNAVLREHFGTGLNAITTKPGHSAQLLNFTTEWLSYHDHPKVASHGIHDLAPFQARLGSLNDFPSPLNNVELSARHCSRHTLNRNRCVRGGKGMPNLELQILNDMIALQLCFSVLFVMLGGFHTTFAGGALSKPESLLRNAISIVRALLLALFLGFQVGGTLPLPAPHTVKLSKFTVLMEGARFSIGVEGVALKQNKGAQMMLSGNRANGFVSLYGGVVAWFVVAVLICGVAFCLARLLGTPCIWGYDIFANNVQLDRKLGSRERLSTFRGWGGKGNGEVIETSV